MAVTLESKEALRCSSGEVPAPSPRIPALFLELLFLVWKISRTWYGANRAHHSSQLFSENNGRPVTVDDDDAEDRLLEGYCLQKRHSHWQKAWGGGHDPAVAGVLVLVEEAIFLEDAAMGTAEAGRSACMYEVCGTTSKLSTNQL